MRLTASNKGAGGEGRGGISLLTKEICHLTHHIFIFKDNSVSVL